MSLAEMKFGSVQGGVKNEEMINDDDFEMIETD
jgi:hypothetical protein